MDVDDKAKRRSRWRRVTIVAVAFLANCIYLEDCSSSTPMGDASVDASTDSGIASEGGEAGTCQGDLSNDPANCGRCGHSCIGGACVAGACQPFALALEQVTPVLVGIDKDFIYYYSDAVYRVAKGGGAPLKVAPPSSGARVGSKWIYESLDYSTLLGLDRGGKDSADAASAAPIIGTISIGPYGLTPQMFGELPNGNILVGEFSIVPPGADYIAYVAELPPDGEPDGGFPADYFGTAEVLNTEALGQTIYSLSGNLFTYFAPPTIAEIDMSGDAGTRSIVNSVNATGVARDAQRVYWADPDYGLIRAVAVPPTGSATDVPTSLAAGQYGPNSLVIDATNLYWSTDPGGTVVMCPLSGCGTSPRVLAQNQGRPMTVLVDETAVFWAQNNAGAIMEVAK